MEKQNFKFERPDWLPRHLYPFEDKFIEIESNRVHYIDEGSGETLLFIHGNPDWSFLYRDIIKELRSSYRCIAIDFPGFGFSKAKEGYNFTPREHAQIVEKFIELLDLNKLTMILHDWGGPIGIWAGARQLNRMEALVITATLAWPDFKDSQPWWIKLMMKGIIGEKGKERVMKTNTVVKAVLKYNMKRNGKIPSEEIQAAYLGPFPTPQSRIPTWVFPYYLYGNAGQEFLTEVEEDIQKLSHLPTLFIWGDKDFTNTVKRELARFQKEFPNHETYIVKGGMHFFPETHPEEVIKALLNWNKGNK